MVDSYHSFFTRNYLSIEFTIPFLGGLGDVILALLSYSYETFLSDYRELTSKILSAFSISIKSIALFKILIIPYLYGRLGKFTFLALKLKGGILYS